LLPATAGPIDVSLTARGGRRHRQGIVIHRPPGLRSTELTLCQGIPVTRAARTLQDLRRVEPKFLQRATRRALDLGLISEDDLPRDTDLTRSELERLFLALCRRRNLPSPEVNARIGRWEVDFLWRNQAVIVETDGYRHHGDRLAFERDRIRGAELQALGFMVLRFSYSQVTGSPGVVAAAVRTALGSGRFIRGMREERAPKA
jgi:very-short-patch-repair endonuclease